jgi:hypothetical protein
MKDNSASPKIKKQSTTMDEQTGDFFNPPEASDDYAAYDGFFAPPGDDSNVGDVYYGSMPDESGAAFFNPPEATEDMMNEPAPIILGAPATDFEDHQPAPTGAGVENVDEDDEEDLMIPAATPTTTGVFSSSSSEPTPMQKWNDEWQQTLLARKDEENAKKASDVETARAEIEAFQAEREKRREARMVKNRLEEQDKLEAIEADLENDNSWQKVVKMIELNQDSTDGAESTGRMRDVLVLLKNEPQRAEGLTA